MTWTNLPKPGQIASIDKNRYVGSQAVESSGFIAWAQSFSNVNADTLRVCRFYLAKSATITGNAFATLYAHSGTFGTSSIPTGSALATSDNFDVSSLALGASASDFRLINFNFANGYDLEANTNYCIAINYTGGNASDYLMLGIATVSASEGNLSASTNLSAWSPVASSGVIFSVSGDLSYTNIPKPRGSFSIAVGMATGLTISPTYATAHAGGASYTNISKPSSGSWTNISKPT